MRFKKNNVEKRYDHVEILVESYKDRIKPKWT